MRAEVGPARTARLWVPHQHGAWAMLALPILVGVASSRFVPGQVLLGAAAVAVYLASATVQAWLRSRRRASYVPSILAYAAAATLFGIPLVLLEPRLILAAIVAGPAGALTLAASRPGTPRELALSLAHVAQASVLAPAAMLLGGETRSLGARCDDGGRGGGDGRFGAGGALGHPRTRQRGVRGPLGRLPRGDHAGGCDHTSVGLCRARRIPDRPRGRAAVGAPPAGGDPVGPSTDPRRGGRGCRVDRPRRRRRGDPAGLRLRPPTGSLLRRPLPWPRDPGPGWSPDRRCGVTVGAANQGMVAGDIVIRSDYVAVGKGTAEA